MNAKYIDGKVYWNGKRLTDNQIKRLEKTGHPHLEYGANPITSFDDRFPNGYFIYEEQDPQVRKWKDGEKTIISYYPLKFNKYSQRWKMHPFKTQATLLETSEEAIEIAKMLSERNEKRIYEVKKADGSCTVFSCKTEENKLISYINPYFALVKEGVESCHQH